MKFTINFLALIFGLLLLDAHAEQDKANTLRAQAEKEVRAGKIGYVMVHIPGTNYEIGKYEVTQSEWRAVMQDNPSYFKSCGGPCPMERVSWEDVQQFISLINAETGKQYRLPTEAEWEYACYGGSKTEYCGGDDLDAVGWFNGNSDGKTHPVGQKQANGYGLYDMSGNVWEWTGDCFDDGCLRRVVRGGSWVNIPRDARVAKQFGFDPMDFSEVVGFRLARTLP